MKNKSLIPILMAILILLLFCFPQYVVSGKPKNPVKFIESLKNPIPSGIYHRGICSPYGHTVPTAQLELSRIKSVATAQFNAHAWSNITPATKRDFHPNMEVLTGGLHHRDLDRQIRFSSRSHQGDVILNSPHPTSVWTIPLLGTLASSFKANPSLCGNWYVLESDYPHLESELIDFNHTSINEYISISENGVSFFSCGQAILSTDVLADYINSLHNETSEITWLDKNAIFIDVHFGNCSKELILRRVTKEIPSRFGRTIGKSTSPHIITLPQRDVEADSHSRLSHHVKIDASSEDANIKLLVNDCLIDYIDIRTIIEQQIKQRIEQMEEQLFKKSMQFDFESKDEVGFIIYTYGYKLDAA